MALFKNPLGFNSKLEPYERYVEELRTQYIAINLEKEAEIALLFQKMTLVVFLIKYVMNWFLQM